jgi:hypothetical protein
MSVEAPAPVVAAVQAIDVTDPGYAEDCRRHGILLDSAAVSGAHWRRTSIAQSRVLLAKLAETPTHAIAMTDVCGTAGPEKVATFHVPNTGSLGADAQAAATT